MGKWLFFLKSALLICALSAASIVLALLAARSPDLAAWVQAVGSIAALFIAIFVMARQNRNAARLMIRQNRHSTKLVADADRLATIRRGKSVHAVMRRTYIQLLQIERAMLAPPQPGESIDQLQSRFLVTKSVLARLKATMDQIPAFDLGSFDMADGVLQLADGLELYEDILRLISADPAQAGTEYVQQVMATHRLTNVDEAVAKFNNGLAQLQAEGKQRPR